MIHLIDFYNINTKTNQKIKLTRFSSTIHHHMINLKNA